MGVNLKYIQYRGWLVNLFLAIPRVSWEDLQDTQKKRGWLVNLFPANLRTSTGVDLKYIQYRGWLVSLYNTLPASGPLVGVDLKYIQYRGWLVKLFPASLRTSTQGKHKV